MWMQAIRAAKESVVMLDNKDGVLPLDAKKIKKLLVLGPNADEVRTGDYSAAGWVRRHNIIMQYNIYICNMIIFGRVSMSRLSRACLGKLSGLLIV